jgi:hypothetical protein
VTGPVRILGFVNHIAPVPDIEDEIARAFEWGVDAIVAQGTGSDWGPYWLGSGEQVAANQAANVEPYVRAALEHGVPFVFSFGIAGGDPHLETCLRGFDATCARNGWAPRVGVVRSELDKGFLAAAVSDGPPVVPASEGSGHGDLTLADVADAERVVALIGPEPVMELLGQDVDGVLTGRALDIGLFMALPMMRGIPKAIAAHAGKMLECGGLALEPGDSGRSIWASLDDTGFEVRSPSRDARPSVRSLVSHTFYERSHPTLEENPGGVLDLSAATYVETPEGGVRCEGAQWHERPYTVLLEGARREGFRAVSLLGVREPALLAQARGWTDRAEEAVRTAPRFADAVAAGRLRISTRIFGLDAVLGDLEPHREVTGHEAGVLVDVVAETEELAKEAAYFAFIRLFIGPYPGRKTTAGNAAAPIMPVVVPVSDVYSFSIYHLLPLEDPVAPFRLSVETFPRTVPATAHDEEVSRATV